MVVNAKFSEWACGFSGCDGGDPRGKYWFCGIEWGGGEDEAGFRSAVEKGNPEPWPACSEWWGGETFNSGLNRGAVQLYARITGRESRDYREIARAERLFSQGQNLSPGTF